MSREFQLELFDTLAKSPQAEVRVDVPGQTVPNRNVHLYFDAYMDNFKSAYDYWQTATKEAYDETRQSHHGQMPEALSSSCGTSMCPHQRVLQ